MNTAQLEKKINKVFKSGNMQKAVELCKDGLKENPSNADVILTINSGIDVPIDTIVNPITISGILNFLAIPTAPSTK